MREKEKDSYVGSCISLLHSLLRWPLCLACDGGLHPLYLEPEPRPILPPLCCQSQAFLSQLAKDLEVTHQCNGCWWLDYNVNE